MTVRNFESGSSPEFKLELGAVTQINYLPLLIADKIQAVEFVAGVIDTDCIPEYGGITCENGRSYANRETYDYSRGKVSE